MTKNFDCTSKEEGIPLDMQPLLARFIASTVLLATVAFADETDRGHRLLMERGLQLQALVLDRTQFDHELWVESNFTTVNFWAMSALWTLGPAPGIPWARWFGGNDLSDDLDLSEAEIPYLDKLVSIQAGDEQDLRKPEIVQKTADIFRYWRTRYPDQIHVLSQQLKYMDRLEPHMDKIQPDTVGGGSYRLNNRENFIGEPIRRGGSPQKMYKELLMLRALCLKGHAGSGGKPIPYGIYTQVFYQEDSKDWELIVSESQMRLQQMAAWALGCKWICAFIYNDSVENIAARNPGYLPVFFGEGGDWHVPTERFYQYAQLNGESRYLGPALVRLVSTDVRMVSGSYYNPLSLLSCIPIPKIIPLPEGMAPWTADSDPYIISIAQTNLGETNDGLPGDVLVGYFTPLSDVFEGTIRSDETYFMVVNSMAFQDASSAQTRQRIDLTFDFSGSTINSLQRLSRVTGEVETVPLESLDDDQYKLSVIYGGGEGDLYKFNTGLPFIPEE